MDYQLIDVMQDLVDRHQMKQCQLRSHYRYVTLFSDFDSNFHSGDHAVLGTIESGRKDAAGHAENAFRCIKASSELPDEIFVSLLLSA